MSDELGSQPPSVPVPLPGEHSVGFVEILARTESPAFTARRARRAERSGASHDPIVWSEARGANVRDVDGNVYVDLTSGFGAASIGHSHPHLLRAMAWQSARIVHALGDVYPSDTKVRLLERLTMLAPWSDARVILGLSGSDAIDAALKTAVLATGRHGVLAFDGGYHGLGYGPLGICGYNENFRAPFTSQLNPDVVFAPYPRFDMPVITALESIVAVWNRAASPIGAVVVEPVLGRGGVVRPPAGFLAGLKALCAERGALLIADEILTGLGRCGALWRSVTEGAMPDLICVGKALGGGLPISACLGRSEVMSSWAFARARGHYARVVDSHEVVEAIHTGTFFGYPLGCAAALASLDVIQHEGLVERSATMGGHLLETIRMQVGSYPNVVEIRGVGMMIGVVLDRGERALEVARRLLQFGYLVLTAGKGSEVLQLLPPLNIEPELLNGFMDALEEALTLPA